MKALVSSSWPPTSSTNVRMITCSFDRISEIFSCSSRYEGRTRSNIGLTDLDVITPCSVNRIPRYEKKGRLNMMRTVSRHDWPPQTAVSTETVKYHTGIRTSDTKILYDETTSLASSFTSLLASAFSCSQRARSLAS